MTVETLSGVRHGQKPNVFAETRTLPFLISGLTALPIGRDS